MDRMDKVVVMMVEIKGFILVPLLTQFKNPIFQIVNQIKNSNGIKAWKFCINRNQIKM